MTLIAVFVTNIGASFASADGSYKEILSKEWQIQYSFVSLFLPKKVHFKAKIDSFLTFISTYDVKKL